MDSVPRGRLDWPDGWSSSDGHLPPGAKDTTLRRAAIGPTEAVKRSPEVLAVTVLLRPA